MQVHLTAKSRNVKTGPIPVSTTSRKSCSKSCPYFGNGCYADGGPLAIHWRNVTNETAGHAWDVFCSAVAAFPDRQLWRHNQAGDLPGNRRRLNKTKVRGLTKANRGKRGFTYCHYDPIGDHVSVADAKHNRETIRDANDGGFTVNLSGNNPAHADKLADLNIAPVVCVLPSDAPRKSYTPGGRLIIACPATYRDNITCATCGLCQKQNNRAIVGFPAHGASKRKAGLIAAQ